MTNNLSQETLSIDMDEDLTINPYPIEPENEVIRGISIDDTMAALGIKWFRKLVGVEKDI